MLFKNTNILLGVTGSISAYKSALLARKLIKQGAQVQVIMTKSATQFITPLTFNTLTNRDVYTHMFDGDNAGTRHIDLGKWADVILVAPATANLIAKVAHGIADDLLTSLIIAFKKRRICFAPAMNVNMYNNQITQANIAHLRGLGYNFIEPEAGELACGDEGAGRLAQLEDIQELLYRYLQRTDLLQGQHVVVTAGPTREYFDEIRYITNRSTGKMGYALAQEAARAGADVTLISGPTNLRKPVNVNRIEIETAQEMQQALLQQVNTTDYLFMAAAVEDIAPQNKQKQKIKKGQLTEQIAIQTNPDLIQTFCENDQKACVVGFSVEMEAGVERSLAKIQQKGLDFIVWNDPSQSGAGFATDTNEVTLLAKAADKYHFPRADKRKIASQIIAKVVDLYE